MSFDSLEEKYMMEGTVTQDQLILEALERRRAALDEVILT
jgi:hypothetical protein